MNKSTRYPDLWTWRHAERLTQAEAAKKFGISQAYYSRLEAGRAATTGQRAKVITAKTGVPIEVLVGAA